MKWVILLPAAPLALAAALAFLVRRLPSLRPLSRLIFPLLMLVPVNLVLGIFRSPWHPWSAARFPWPQIESAVWLLFWLVLLVVLLRLVVFIIFDWIARRQQLRYSNIIRDVVVFLLFVVGLLTILHYHLGLKLGVLLGTSAVVTVVIGLAIQDILGSVFAGIFMTFEDSFHLGDWARIRGREGRIEQLGWRSIKIRTVDNETVVIPNQAAAKEDVTLCEFHRRPFAQRVQASAAYRHSPDQVISVLERAAGSVDTVRTTPSPQALVLDFADSGITYQLKYWIDEFSQAAPIAGEVRRRIWYLFQRAGIEIPYPVREIHPLPPPPGPVDPAPGMRENSILAALSDAEWAGLQRSLDTCVFGRGEVFIREGEFSSHFCHIVSGRVEIRHAGKVLTTSGPGDFFGEISLVTGEPAGATVTAAEETVVVRIPQQKFRETVKMSEELARQLSEVIVRRQAELREFSEQHTAPDRGAIAKASENLFRRIIKYFNTAPG